MRSFRLIAAGLALLGLLLPWAHIVAVSAHAASHHEGGPPHHAAELGDAFHGHHHPGSETDHRHSLVAFDLVAQRAKSIDGMSAPACARAIARSWNSPPADAIARGRGLTDSGDGPPRVPVQKSILRV